MLTGNLLKIKTSLEGKIEEEIEDLDPEQRVKVLEELIECLMGMTEDAQEEISRRDEDEDEENVRDHEEEDEG